MTSAHASEEALGNYPAWLSGAAGEKELGGRNFSTCFGMTARAERG